MNFEDIGLAQASPHPKMNHIAVSFRPFLPLAKPTIYFDSSLTGIPLSSRISAYVSSCQRHKDHDLGLNVCS